MNRLLAPFLLLCSLLDAGCEPQTRPSTDMTVGNVVRIFMHEQREYSVLQTDGSELKHWTFGESWNPTGEHRFFIDVAPNGSAWVSCKDPYEQHEPRHFLCDELDIHIHAPGDIEGGGWNHGKHGRGQVNAIE